MYIIRECQGTQGKTTMEMNTTTTIITAITEDGTLFSLTKEEALEMSVFASVIADCSCETNDSIPVIGIATSVFARMVQFAKFVNPHAAHTEDEKKAFFDSFFVMDEEIMHPLLNAANQLGYTLLLNIGCEYEATRYKGMSRDEIYKAMHFTREKLAELEGEDINFDHLFDDGIISPYGREPEEYEALIAKQKADQEASASALAMITN